MAYRVQATIEWILISITFHWQPFFGVLSAIIAAWYYLAMLKMNVIDSKYSGSWKKYFKQILKF